jgi:hypothetical protein
MPLNEYEFFTEWRVEAPAELLFDILKNGQDYTRWWPDVYLGAEYLPSGSADGIGDRIRLLTKGWLPYRLRWTAETIRYKRPLMIEIGASGDFVGKGIWRLEPRGSETRVTFDWRIRADKPLLRFFSPIFKPFFRWNHSWAMNKGIYRLREEVVRRSVGVAPFRADAASAGSGFHKTA